MKSKTKSERISARISEDLISKAKEAFGEKSTPKVIYECIETCRSEKHAVIEGIISNPIMTYATYSTQTKLYTIRLSITESDYIEYI